MDERPRLSKHFAPTMINPASGFTRHANAGTIADAAVDGQPYIGLNSNSPGYTQTDEDAAKTMRTRLIEKYPERDRASGLPA
ncbi:MAG: hypothetical protein R3D44_14700 [Hyphomicrobiaceae bacterium]